MSFLSPSTPKVAKPDPAPSAYASTSVQSATEAVIARRNTMSGRASTVLTGRSTAMPTTASAMLLGQ